MKIDELLKQQAEWADKMKHLTLDIIKRRTGTTPEEAGLDQAGEVEDRIKVLETRRAAILNAFDTAIEMERRGGEPVRSGGGETPTRPVRATEAPAKAAPKRRKAK